MPTEIIKVTEKVEKEVVNGKDTYDFKELVSMESETQGTVKVWVPGRKYDEEMIATDIEMFQSEQTNIAAQILDLQHIQELIATSKIVVK